MRRLLKLFRAFPVACMVLALAACGDDPVIPPAEVVGTYQLTEMDGDSLPVTVFTNEQGTLAVADGALDLKSDGDFRLGLGVLERPTEGDSIPHLNQTIGEFEVSGTRIALRPREGSAAQGSVIGDTITFDWILFTGESYSLAFVR